MRKRWSIQLMCMALLFVVGCGNNTTSNVSCAKKIQTQRIANSNTMCIDVLNGNIMDGMYLAVLDFEKLEENKIYAEIYEKEIFRTYDIAKLSIDDIIVVDNKSIDIDTITYDSGSVIVNKGDINEVLFIPQNDDEYVANKESNPYYLKALSGNIKLSENVILVKEGRIYKGLKNITGWIKEKGLVSNQIETLITIKNEEITQIEIETIERGLATKDNGIEKDILYDAPVNKDKLNKKIIV